MTKVEIYERFLHTPIVACLIDVAFTRQNLTSSWPTFSEFL
jgi:hypothetical protein